MEKKDTDAPSKTPQWKNLERYTSRVGISNNPDFDGSEGSMDNLKEAKVLIIGSGGLGCEVLKNLALMGFGNIHVLDKDIVKTSDLINQFMFRDKDVGRPKAVVASEFVKRRVVGSNVTSYHCKLNDMPIEFYNSFYLVICGVDSMDARRWINCMLLSQVLFDSTETGLEVSYTIPLIEGGTEGFKGSCRVILPGATPCVDCQIDLYLPKRGNSLCTLENIPWRPEHCVQYVKRVIWPKENPWGIDTAVDVDDPMHMNWLLEKSRERAVNYGITGVTNRTVVDALGKKTFDLPSSFAVVGAIMANQAFKIVAEGYISTSRTQVVINNADGIYCHTYDMDMREDCVSCSHNQIEINVNPDTTLGNLIQLLCDDTNYQFVSPSVTVTEDIEVGLYVSDVPSYEVRSRENLNKTLSYLMRERKEKSVLRSQVEAVNSESYKLMKEHAKLQAKVDNSDRKKD